MPADQKSFPLLTYQASIGKDKPITLGAQHGHAVCPFCDRSQLPPVLKQDGDVLLVPNKYPILKGSSPYVLIETSECESELSLYPIDRLVRVLRMGVSHWLDMAASGEYRSVIFIKNHGPFSGGSLRHPHMQIIGFQDVDCYTHVRRDALHGPVIHQAHGVELNVSDRPQVGFVEFNTILSGGAGLIHAGDNEMGADAPEAFSYFCLLIQKAVQYLLQYFHNGSIDSYNLFFYAFDGDLYCKAMPRTATTPIFVGYTIPQVTDSLDEIMEDFRERLFS
ncbi:MAG: DUF4931 domain-containing protein [Clostridiales bacterium]|nr:DUF4931 domain-containing protein [Clostridiales bacterium]